MIDDEHKRSSLRLGNAAEVWWRCGWKVEIVADSGGEASDEVAAAWAAHLADVAEP